MRGKIAIVLIAGVFLAASLLWLEFLASLHASNFYESSLPFLSSNENSGVVNSSSTRSTIANPVGWTQSAQDRKKIPLDILTDEQGQNVSCPPNTQPIFNNPLPCTNFSSDYKIPFVIHQTFKTRCVTDDFYQLTLAWKALGIPYYFHDDAAIERLVRLGYEEFPHLILTWEHCITKPVVKTDLWRLLLLYEYGGIYADLDTKPVSFQPNTTLRMDDEMYTVPDQMGLPSFHFMASMPRHPVPFLTLHRSLYELLFMKDTGKYNPAKKTGPGALKWAMAMFLHNQDRSETQIAQIGGDEFTFHGMGGHTLRRDRRTSGADTIVRECAFPNKENRFQSNNATHYSRTKDPSGESCFDIITNHYDKMD